jgi:UDP-glucose 4-epimerase
VKKMKVVVTGGSGFIGSHVVDAMVEGGHQVTVIDHRVRPHRTDVNFEDIDLLDLSSVMVATRGAEQIFHLAAVSNVNYAFKYPAYSTALNVMGTTNVLEAARQNEAKRVHLASTVWVYNGAPDGVTADESVPFYLNGAGHRPRWPARCSATTTASSTTCRSRCCATASPTVRACARSC